MGGHVLDRLGGMGASRRDHAPHARREPGMERSLGPDGRDRPAGAPAAFGDVLRRYRAAAGLTQAAWEAALKAGGNRDSTLRILPKANHL